MDKLVKDNLIEVKGDDVQESLFFVKEFDELFSIYIETADNYTQTENMDNIHPGNNEFAKESDKSLSDLEQFFDNVTVDKAAHKATDSMSLLYERMISNLQSEALFLKEQLKFKDIYFNGEILYLRNQLNDCLHRIQIKRDDSDFLSCTDKLNLLKKNLNSPINIPSRELNLIDDQNELNKNDHYDIDR